MLSLHKHWIDKSTKTVVFVYSHKLRLYRISLTRNTYIEKKAVYDSWDMAT